MGAAEGWICQKCVSLTGNLEFEPSRRIWGDVREEIQSICQILTISKIGQDCYLQGRSRDAIPGLREGRCRGGLQVLFWGSEKGVCQGADIADTAAEKTAILANDKKLVLQLMQAALNIDLCSSNMNYLHLWCTQQFQRSFNEHTWGLTQRCPIMLAQCAAQHYCIQCNAML